MKKQGRNAAALLPQLCVILLAALFAASAAALTLLGAKAYCGAVERSERHGDGRMVSAFIRNAVRAEDRRGAIRVERHGETTALAIETVEDGERYIRRIYVSDGMLRELYTSAERPFDPAGGEEICAAKAMTVQIRGGLVEAVVTDAQGQETAVYAALCAREAE